MPKKETLDELAVDLFNAEKTINEILLQLTKDYSVRVTDLEYKPTGWVQSTRMHVMPTVKINIEIIR